MGHNVKAWKYFKPGTQPIVSFLNSSSLWDQGQNEYLQPEVNVISTDEDDGSHAGIRGTQNQNPVG